LKKALGDFMKGLDFKSVAPDTGVSDEDDDEEEEDVSEGESTGDDEDEEDEDEDEEEDEDDEEDDEEEEEEEDESEMEAAIEAPVARAAVQEKPKAEKVAKPAEPKAEIDITSGKVSQISRLPEFG
jgi:ribosome biogenesis protein MAK21